MLPCESTTKTLNFHPGTCLLIRREVSAAATAFMSRSTPDLRRALRRCKHEVAVSCAKPRTAYESMIYALPSSPASFSQLLSPEPLSLPSSSSSIASLSRRSVVYDDDALSRTLPDFCGLNTAFTNSCEKLPSEGYVSELVSLSDAFRARK